MTTPPTDPSLSGTVPILFEALGYSLLNAPLVVLVFAVLLYTSGSVVHRSLEYAGVELSRSDSDSSDENDPIAEDTGAVIGKAENVLVLTLMLLQAYTALGVIFAAKSIVRKSDMGREDTSYYLTGTMANFTYSVVVGLVLHLSLWAVVRFDLYGGLSAILG
jgi:hypothetical protein